MLAKKWLLLSPAKIAGQRCADAVVMLSCKLLTKTNGKTHEDLRFSKEAAGTKAHPHPLQLATC